MLILLIIAALLAFVLWRAFVWWAAIIILAAIILLVIFIPILKQAWGEVDERTKEKLWKRANEHPVIFVFIIIVPCSIIMFIFMSITGLL